MTELKQDAKIFFVPTVFKEIVVGGGVVGESAQ